MKASNNAYIVWIVILGLFLSGCQKKSFESRSELLAYMSEEDHGYTVKKTVQGIDFTVTYRPTDLLVDQELSAKTKKVDIENLRSKYSKYLYFNVAISKNNQEVLNSMADDRNAFGSMVNQLAFGMGEKVHLFSKTKDTVPLADYVYPRLYGMGNSTSMLFVYPREEALLEHEYFNITIEDLGLATGEVGFKIPTELIENEPKIKF